MKNLLFSIIATIMFGLLCHAQSDNKTLPFFDGLNFTTQSHLISYSGDCYTIWVGLYTSDEDGTSLLLYGIVTVGSSCRISSNTDNPICKNEYINGDYVENSDTKELKYCLTECLKDERVYSLYQSDKNKILAENKK